MNQTTARHLDTRPRIGGAVTTWVQRHDRDQLSRKLRLSLTDACNLRCFFCHNEGQAPPAPASRAMPGLEDVVRMVRAAVQAGVREIKLTGGEPLLYRDGPRTIVDLVRRIADLRTEPFGLSMTTNGVLLGRHAAALKAAGLDRVTVSLHTLDDRRFGSLIGPRSRPGLPAAIATALRTARDAGLTPVKVNTVLFGQGSDGNVDEIPQIVRACRAAGVHTLRLYTLLRHQNFPDHARWYRFWDDDLLHSVGAALYGGRAAAAEFARRALGFVQQWKGELYPKPTFVAEAGELQLEIETMESGRFDALEVADEGPYALRLSAAGLLRGALDAAAPALDLREPLRRGDEALVAAFRTARRELLP